MFWILLVCYRIIDVRVHDSGTYIVSRYILILHLQHLEVYVVKIRGVPRPILHLLDPDYTKHMRLLANISSKFNYMPGP